QASKPVRARGVAALASAPLRRLRLPSPLLPSTARCRTVVRFLDDNERGAYAPMSTGFAAQNREVGAIMCKCYCSVRQHSKAKLDQLVCIFSSG
ncbi:Os07g0646400, partial [Oryza sativa Japonica Group]